MNISIERGHRKYASYVGHKKGRLQSYRLICVTLACLLHISLAVASTYNLRVEVTPTGSGTLNTSGGTYEESSNVRLRTYVNTGYVFKGWYEGDKLLSSSTSYNYIMPSNDVLVQAKYEYDPTVPGNPAMPDTATYYTFIATVSPVGAGTLNTYNGKYAANATVKLRTYGNTGYQFVGWQNEEGETLSSSTSFNYTMPRHNSQLTALYVYDPSVPANPDSMSTSYTVNVACKPVGGGTFNTTSATAEEGGNVRLYAYTNTGYRFLRWENETGETISTAQNFYYIIPHGDSKVYGIFEYDPAVPGNPNKNSWNKTTGEVIVDDFSAGKLGDAVSAVIDGSDRSIVSMITVAGRMNDNDFGIANNYTNCTLLDLSRVAGITQVPSYAFDYTNLESVYLPVTIETIGNRAFYECKQLSSLTIYAMIPPTLENGTFTNVSEGMVVYVPANAIAQYQNAEGWKNFTILPIQEDIRSLSIFLPEGTNVQDYAQMWLELTNTKSGQRMHYVMTNRAQYTFTNIIRNTTWNVTLRNERGDVFGKIENIEVKDEDVSVTFESLKQPQNVALHVFTAGGDEVTSQVQTTWLDATGIFLSRGNTVKGVIENNALTVQVALPQTLGTTYIAPTDTIYVVQARDNKLNIVLKPLPQATISGTVMDMTTGSTISNAVVSVSQTLNGKYSKAFTTKTDDKGAYSLTVYDAPSAIIYSASDYISQTVNYEDFSASSQLEEVALKSITGATITTSFTYRTSVEEGATPDIQDWYSDYANVSYSIYNKTQQQPINDFSVQYPSIVLLEEVAEGDELVLTATSKNGAFVPVEATAVIDASNRAEAIFDIVALGGIKASFTSTDNAAVVGILYNAGGQLVKKYNYSSATININDLQDGKYTLVSMGSSTLFNSIYNLSQLASTGLKEGTDFVKNTVIVESGLIATISNDLIPTLDESKLYYTGDNTMFSVNKTSVTAGNYLTLKGKIDFKNVYASKVSNVSMVIDLPESAEFVENSVMVGTSISSYTLDGNRLTIPLERYTDQVRFCIIPTTGGDYAPNAFAQFSIDGKEVLQPIGSAHYTIKDLSISVPNTVAKTTIPISGTALGNSTIQIYDNDVLIGQTTSMANSTWATTCDLNEPYNLSMHNIYAKVTTKAGLELISETKQVMYDVNMIVPEKVTMLYYNPEFVGQYNIVFDLINGTVSPKFYYFFPYKSYPNWSGSGTEPKEFTFIADLSNNDSTAVNGVTIRVYTDNGYWRNLEAQYNTSMNKWVAVSQFVEEEAPVGVEVEIDTQSEMIADRDKIDEDLSVTNSMFTELEQDMDRINNLLSPNLDDENSECFMALQNFLESDNYDASEVNKWIQSVMYKQTSGDVMTDEMADSLTIQYQEELDVFLDKLKNSQDSSVYALLYLPNEMDLLAPTSGDVSFEHEGYRYEQKKWTPVIAEDLLNDGFLYYNLTDSTQVFFKYEDSGLIIIDTKKAVEYSMQPVVGNANGRLYEPYKASHAGFKQCVQDWSSLVANIVKYKNVESNLELKNVLFIANQLCGTVKGVIDASSCFYRGYLLEFDYRLETGYKKLVKEIEDKVEARRNLIDKHWERIKIQNDMISQQEDMIRQYQKEIDALYAQALNTSDPDILKELEKQIAYNKDWIKASNEHIKLNKKIISDINTKDINPIEKQINLLTKEREGVEEGYRLAKKAAGKIPSTLSKGEKVTVWTKLGKLTGPLGILCDVIDIYVTSWEAYDEIQEWIDLGNSMLRKLPCEGNPEEAESLSKDIKNNFIGVLTSYASIIGTKAGAAALNRVDVPVFTPHWWVASGLNIYAEWANLWTSNHYITLRGDFWLRIYNLKCEKDKCPRCGKNPCVCKDKCPKCGKSPCVCPPPSNTIDVQHDPSGYVYEGVSSNRVEGVMASCYYKETVEDMYGDLHENVVLWDAEQYAQENPLFTDANGMYRWDVPKGLWQVKFEKEGYETAYSDWLPVPPPQLEVNVGVVQNKQPEVKTVYAYEDGIVVEFDKYMQPATLNTDNIYVLQNGEKVVGTVMMLNEEVAYKDESETYASKVRFVFEQSMTAEEIILTVSNRVKSYAGVRMQDTYTQTFDVEKEIKSIVADSLVTMFYGAEHTLTVKVTPSEAAAGKILVVKSLTEMILSVDNDSIVLDDNGEAVVTIIGELPGSGVISYSLTGYAHTASTIVKVDYDNTLITTNPTASIASGTTVAKGTEVILSCSTEGAAIYYTLDGSCPCDDTAILYDGTPIVINDNTELRIMAVAEGRYESDVVVYHYYVEGANVEDVVLPLGINPTIVKNGFRVQGVETDCTVSVYGVSGELVLQREHVKNNAFVNIAHAPEGMYIVMLKQGDDIYKQRILKVE